MGVQVAMQNWQLGCITELYIIFVVEKLNISGTISSSAMVY